MYDVQEAVAWGIALISSPPPGVDLQLDRITGVTRQSIISDDSCPLALASGRRYGPAIDALSVADVPVYGLVGDLHWGVAHGFVDVGGWTETEEGVFESAELLAAEWRRQLAELRGVDADTLLNAPVRLGCDCNDCEEERSSL